MIPRVLAKQGWEPRYLALALLFGALAVVATLQAWVDIVNIAWRDEESNHIFLVPVVAAWLVYVRQARFLRCPPGGSIIGPIIVLIGALFHVLGYERGIQSFWHGGAVLIVIGALLSVLGKHVLFRFFPAFAVLVFLVPVPGQVREAVSIPLQAIGARAAHALLQVFGVQTELSGNVVSINGMNVAVAEACNGMRMVFALVLVSYAFAFGTPLRGYVRVLILAVSPIAALLCNIPRLAATVLAYAYGSKEFGDSFHDVAGWAMLPLALLMLIGITRALRWALLPVERFTLAYQ